MRLVWLVALAGLMAVMNLALAQAPVRYFEVNTAEELVAAAAAMPKDGGTIIIHPGTYLLEGTLLFRGAHSITVSGLGWGTVLRRQGPGDAIRFVDCSFSAVRNMMIHGDPTATEGAGIVFEGACGSNVVDFCRLTSFAESGLRFEGTADKGSQSSNTVSNCHFIDNGQDQLYSSRNNDFYIVGNQFGAHSREGENAPQTGARLEYSSAGTYSMNYHWSNRVAFRLGPGSNYNRVENNRFEMSYEQGVIIGDPEGGWDNWLNIFLGNTFHTNSMGESGKWPAVEAFDAKQTLFSSNQVFSWNAKDYKHKSSLVLARGCHGWLIKDNFLLNNTEAALVLGEATGCVVKDNIEE